MSYVSEIDVKTESGDAELNQHLRNDDSQLNSMLGEQIYAPGHPTNEAKEDHNSLLALSGDHAGFSLVKANTLLQGVPGTTYTEHSTVEGHAVLDGLHFRSIGNETNRLKLLTLGVAARVLIRNCVFERISGDPLGVFVSIADGGKAIFTNCIFRSDEASGAMKTGTGTVVTNAGAAGNVYVGVGFNFTGLAHVNTTLIAPELT